MSAHFLNELQQSFREHAARPALVYREQTWTYGEMDDAARRCGAWLLSLGLAPGDRVAFCTPNKLPFLIAQLGTLYAGGVPLPLNPRFTREELRYFLTDSQARFVFSGDSEQVVLRELQPELPNSPEILLDEGAVTAPAASWKEVQVAAAEPCLILYSSGTTGWPKGVVHTNANVGSSLAALAKCWRMSPDDKVVNVLPLFHIHGLAFATYLTWLTGGCLLVDDSFDTERTMQLIARSTVFMAVPPMYYRLLDDPRFANSAKTWTKTRLFTCGSAPIRPEVLPRLEEILRKPVINRYGMSEAFVITSLPLAGPWPYGSVGPPLEGVELEVVDEHSHSMPTGEVGSVRIRGPNLFQRYWNKPAETQAAFASGWFETGDLGRLDKHGFLTLVGRKHDLIIVSGYNVYPQVVERVLGECPGVAECAVYGLPDEQRGELVAAAVVRNESTLDAAAISAWCRERLVHYQQPRKIVFVESLPRNSLGKVLRRELVQLG